MIESEDILYAFILIVVFPVIMVFVITWIKVLFMIADKIIERFTKGGDKWKM